MNLEIPQKQVSDKILAEWLEYQQPEVEEVDHLPNPMPRRLRSNWPHRDPKPFDAEPITVEDAKERRLRRSYCLAERALEKVTIPLVCQSRDARRVEKRKRQQALRRFVLGWSKQRVQSRLFGKPGYFLTAWKAEIEKLCCCGIGRNKEKNLARKAD